MLNVSAKTNKQTNKLPVKKMAQLLGNVRSKPLADLQLVAIVFVVRHDDPDAQQDKTEPHSLSPL